MEDREDDAPIAKSRLKKAKNFGWGIIRFIFGILFIASIALCVLFATGIIEIQESEDGRSFAFVSPLTEKTESEEIPGAPTDQGESEKEPETENTPIIPDTFAAYDFKFADLLANARTVFPNSNVYVDDLRATTEGDYLIARLFVSMGNYSDARYYYRSTAEGSDWKMIETMTSQAAPVCDSMSEIERKIVRESYPELTQCRHDDGSFENI